MEHGPTGETYRSVKGALAEARHVFLEGSGIGQRLRSGSDAAVLELGFGTGLNFLVSACEASRGTSSLNYVALERQPLGGSQIAALDYAQLLSPCTVPQEIIGWLTRPGRLPPRGSHVFASHGVRLELIVGDAEATTATWSESRYDAVYLDPFSPSVEPGSWEPELLQSLADVLVPGGRLVTYSVSGRVRRRLESAGLAVTKVPGPVGGKRESLVASKPAPASGG